MDPSEVPPFDVTSVGEALVDFVAPDADELGSASAFIRAAGGAPANVAVAAARLGARSVFLGAVGDDPFGAYLRNVLQENGVDTQFVRSVQARTTLAFVARNRGGIPDFLFYRGADAQLRSEDLPQLLLERSRFIHCSSLALMTEPSASATRAAALAAGVAGALVSVDPNLRPTSWPSVDAMRTALDPLIQRADVLKVNDEEARLLTGTSDLRQAAVGLAGDASRLVVITLGADGCLWYWQGQTGQVPAPTVEVVETTGAGDAFVGALLAELSGQGYWGSHLLALQPPALEEILRFACAAGACACREAGAMASLPSREEVERLLAG